LCFNLVKKTIIIKLNLFDYFCFLGFGDQIWYSVFKILEALSETGDVMKTRQTGGQKDKFCGGYVRKAQ